jgi:hypothetical protein
MGYNNVALIEVGVSDSWEWEGGSGEVLEFHERGSIVWSYTDGSDHASHGWLWCYTTNKITWTRIQTHIIRKTLHLWILLWCHSSNWIKM